MGCLDFLFELIGNIIGSLFLDWLVWSAGSHFWRAVFCILAVIAAGVAISGGLLLHFGAPDAGFVATRWWYTLAACLFGLLALIAHLRCDI